ncbi:paraquat-inducible protein A [Opitutus sp. ER46]|uniref:paraquat-inducible protein A n=1 Tax=Opitutus sp. ER46 TaxID=2161864 RepID=UPI000D3FBC7F|nr:paraquat-inducible protein A [Opitutus sp. ER46]PTX97816.1 hypothetical protein DB354_05940 [Opitutus sp. ER46]
MEGSLPTPLSCRVCGCAHRAVHLRPGERALCVRCGSRLAARPPQPQAALALTITALIFAVPALRLPLVTVDKFGAEHASYVWSGITALWHNGMPLLSVWVALCGVVVPCTVLASLLMLVSAARPRPSGRVGVLSAGFVAALQRWSMPEVQILAILVAFVKIGAVVQVRPGPGLWCYAGMSWAMLLAWRRMEGART